MSSLQRKINTVLMEKTYQELTAEEAEELEELTLADTWGTLTYVQDVEDKGEIYMRVFIVHVDLAAEYRKRGEQWVCND